VTDKPRAQRRPAAPPDAAERAPALRSDAGISETKLAIEDQSSDAATMKCASCRCDLGERTLVLTLEVSESADRTLCSRCWRKELSGEGELSGTAARSATR
jgi:hypothetical protein